MGFFTRQEHLKYNGQKLHTMELINQYIDENIDELYRKRYENKVVKLKAPSTSKGTGATSADMNPPENVPES